MTANQSIRYETTQTQLDANQNASDILTYTQTTAFALYEKPSFQKITGAGYTSVSLNSITTVKRARMLSDQPLSIKLNAGTYILVNVYDFNIGGDITAIQFENTSGNTANIQFWLYGV